MQGGANRSQFLPNFFTTLIQQLCPPGRRPQPLPPHRPQLLGQHMFPRQTAPRPRFIVDGGGDEPVSEPLSPSSDSSPPEEPDSGVLAPKELPCEPRLEPPPDPDLELGPAPEYIPAGGGGGTGRALGILYKSLPIPGNPERTQGGMCVSHDLLELSTSDTQQFDPPPGFLLQLEPPHCPHIFGHTTSERTMPAT